MSSRREEVAQRKPFKRFFSGLFRKQRGSGPSGTQGLPGTAGCTNRACLRTFECSIVGGTTNLADPTRRKANFLWKFLCAGASPSAMRAPSPIAARPQGFLQSKNALRRTSLPNLLLGTKIVRLFTNQWVLACQKESASKIRRRLPHWKGNANPELPGSQKGRNPFVFTRKRKKQLLPDGSTRRFFAQLRSVGSNYRAGRPLPVELWRLRHGQQKVKIPS